MSHAWVAVCEDCAFLGGDHGDQDAAEHDADLHRAGELHPWQQPAPTVWSPANHWRPRERHFTD